MLTGPEWDWKVTSVDLRLGDKEKVAGVVRFKSKSGGAFKVGASSLGTQAEARDVLNNPTRYISRVYTVTGVS